MASAKKLSYAEKCKVPPAGCRAAAYETARVAEDALKPCSIQEELPFDTMPVTQDQVGKVLKSVSNALDPIA